MVLMHNDLNNFLFLSLRFSIEIIDILINFHLKKNMFYFSINHAKKHIPIIQINNLLN